MNLTLVVGTGRCGTALLARIIDDHPDVLSLREVYTTLSSDRATGQHGGAEALRSLVAGPGHVPGARFDELAPVVRRRPTRPAAAHYRALLEHLAARSGRTTIVDHFTASLHLVPVLHAALPHARIVHLHRDGPDCALSMSHDAGFRTVAPALLDAHPGDRPLGVFGALWSAMVADGVAALDLLPTSLTSTLRYEDLVRSPETTLTRLAATLNTAVDGDWLARARARVSPAAVGRSRDLPPGELAALEAACRPGMKALGLTA